jgi:hypothetical protein
MFFYLLLLFFLTWVGIAYLGWYTGWWNQSQMVANLLELLLRLFLECLSNWPA